MTPNAVPVIAVEITTAMPTTGAEPGLRVRGHPEHALRIHRQLDGLPVHRVHHHGVGLQVQQLGADGTQVRTVYLFTDATPARPGLGSGNRRCVAL